MPGGVGRVQQRGAAHQRIELAVEGQAIGRIGVGQLVARDGAGVQAPALADPRGLLFDALAGDAIGGGTGIAQRQAGLEAARTRRELDRVAVGRRAGEIADLEALQRGNERC